jgi:hypothetical protein
LLLFSLARRLGVRSGGAAAAAGLLVVAMPAVRAWMQLMAEPQTLGALLLAAHIAVGYQETLRWKARCATLLCLLAFVFLTKEVVGALGVAILAIAIAWPPIQRTVGTWWSPRNIALVGGAAAIALAEAIMVVLVRARPEATGYGMDYGKAPLAISRLGNNLLAIVMPVRSGLGTRLTLVYPANVLLIVLAVLGLMAYLRRGGDRRRLAWVVGIGLLPALIGAVAYWPWPKFDSFYAMPFFVGPLLLYGAAIGELLGQGGVRRAFGVIGALLVIGYSTVAASRSTETSAASLQLDATFGRLLARFAPTDTLRVLGPEAGPHVLPVKPEEVRGYAIALGWVTAAASPVVLAVPCSSYVPGSPAAMAETFVSYSYGCGPLPNPTLDLVSAFTWRDWLTLAPILDSLTLDFSGPRVQAVLKRKP